MDFDYVALEWRTGHPKQDTAFAEERREMLDRGWTEHLRALWPAERMPRRLAGGICIMRRLKEEPRMWTEAEIRDLMQEVERRKDARLSGKVNHCLVHPSSAFVGRVGVHTEADING